MGPDLIFVVLTMDMEEVRKRLMARHHGDESVVEMMEVNLIVHMITLGTNDLFRFILHL